MFWSGPVRGDLLTQFCSLFWLISDQNSEELGRTDTRTPHLQETLPGRRFLSGTGGPAPTSRWPDYPQCPARRQNRAVSSDRTRLDRTGSTVTRYRDSPLWVLVRSGWGSTPGCWRRRLRRKQQLVGLGRAGSVQNHDSQLFILQRHKTQNLTLSWFWFCKGP